MVPNSQYNCFRGSIKLPDLGSLAAKHNLGKVHRIRCRKEIQKLSNFTQKPNEDKLERKTLDWVLKNEKLIERKLRSKSGLDSLFELCPMSPWRETKKLWVNKDDGYKLVQLDFKNFYPSILCSSKFAAPNKLWHIYPKEIPQEAGILRAKLHPKTNCPETLKEIHPFQLQTDKRSCPFYIEGPIETFIFTNECKIWSQWFDIEPLEAIISELEINHPLKKRVLEGLEELELLKQKDPENPRVEELKLFINCASTTPKIAQDKYLPSPYGVHCLPAQISSNARALLTQTIHLVINNLPTKDGNILQINTDGFVVKTKFFAEDYLNNPHLAEATEQTPKNPQENKENILYSILGTNPGQLRVKSWGTSGFFLGANTWWLVKEGRVTSESGTGRSKLEIRNSNTIPTHIKYVDKENKLHKINLMHLADYRHRLCHKTGERTKFRIKESYRNFVQTAIALPAIEKNRSWKKIKISFESFQKNFSKEVF